jgi:hypothetical protein
MKDKENWIFAIVIVLIIIGLLAADRCSERVMWRERQVPISQAEREAVAKLETQILANASQLKVVGGDDQDWEDVVIEAHRAAMETAIPIRLFEFRIEAGMFQTIHDGDYTGRYKDFTNDRYKEFIRD